MSRFRTAVRCAVTALAFLSLTTHLRAQGTTDRVEPLRLIGVLDAKTGDWIDHATVRDTLGDETTTTRYGVAALNVLTPIAGFYLLEIRKEGFAPRRIRLRADTTLQLMVALEPNPLGDATRLPAVVTTARHLLEADAGERRGFFYRCQQGVECIGRAELDRRPTGTLDNMLSSKPGVIRQCNPPNHGAVYTPQAASSANAEVTGCLITMRPMDRPGLCTPTYYVDGFEWLPLGGTPQAQIDKFLPPNRIEGIEIYPPGKSHPGRFSTDIFAPCGIVVIWTR